MMRLMSTKKDATLFDETSPSEESIFFMKSIMFDPFFYISIKNLGYIRSTIMDLILEFQEFLETELLQEAEKFSFFPQWKDGGILLIKGIPMKDGLVRLYATRVRRVYSEGLRGFFKAQSYGDFFIVLQKFDGSFVVEKIDGSLPVLGRAMGLKSYVIGLNAKTGKTPLWQESVRETSFPKFLKEFEVPLQNLPGIYYPTSRS